MKTKQAHNAEMPPDMCVSVSGYMVPTGIQETGGGVDRHVQDRPQLNDQSRCSGNAGYWFLALVAQPAPSLPLV